MVEDYCSQRLAGILAYCLARRRGSGLAPRFLTSVQLPPRTFIYSFSPGTPSPPRVAADSGVRLRSSVKTGAIVCVNYYGKKE